MELWLDTTDEKIIVEAAELNILTGVTTNPSILSKETKSPEFVLKRLLDIQPGYVAAQVVASDLAGMLKQADNLSRLSQNNRMIIKIPASQDGFRAIALLKKEGIPTLATAIFETRQLIFAALMGSMYAAPYFNRINTLSGNALHLLREMQEITTAQQFSIKIMAAAIQSSQQFCECVQVGIPAITIPNSVYEDLFACSTPVNESLKKFNEDWLKNNATATAELFLAENL